MELCLKRCFLFLCLWKYGKPSNSARHRTNSMTQEPQAATQPTVCTPLSLSTNVWIKSCKRILFFCRGVWEWRTGQHIFTQEKGSKKRKDRKTQGWAQSWFLLFIVLGWWNQEGLYSWAGHVAHVGQTRNEQIMKGKNWPKRALQNTNRAVRSAWMRFRRRIVMSYIKGTLTVSLSRRTVLCGVRPTITCGFRW